MADWDIAAEVALTPPAAAENPSRAPAREPTGRAPLMGGPGGKGATGGTIRVAPAGDGLPAEADTFYQRITKAEGTAGNPWQFYGGDTFTPGKEHPGEAADRPAPRGRRTHAAGPGQWQPDTWNGLKGDFQQRFGRDPDFSSEADQKRMVWLNGSKHYPGGEAKLRADIAAGKLDTSKLAGEWEGFKPGGSPWATTSGGKWRVKDGAIAYEQGRSNTSVVWMSPDDYLEMTPAAKSAEKRKSLLKSLFGGDDIESIPTLDAKVEKGRLKIIDQDGRSRAQVAKEQGVDLMPVAVHGITGDQAPAWAEDLRGELRRWNYQAVPKVRTALTDEQERQQQTVLGGVERGFRKGFGEAPIGQGTDVARDLSAVGTPGKADLGLPVRALGSAYDAIARGAGAIPSALGGGAEQAAKNVGVGPETSAALGEAVRGAPEVLAGLFGVEVPHGPPGGIRNLPRTVPEPSSVPVSQFLGDAARMGDIENRARSRINERHEQDLAADPTLGRTMGTELEAARAGGQPMAIADVAGENVRGLLGNVARRPGPGRQVVKQWSIGRLGDIDRDSPIATALEKGIEESLGTESARSEARSLAEQRSQGAPLWQKAMDGGDLPAVEEGLARDYQAASKAAETARSAADAAAAKLEELEKQAAEQRVTVPKKPTGLITFLIRNGGLQDQAGEISAVLGGKASQRTRARPGLINNKAGQTLDDAALAAWEAGYIRTSERPTISDLVDAVAQDHNAGGVFSGFDLDQLAEHQAAVGKNAEVSQRETQRPMPERSKVTDKQLQFERDKAADLEARARFAEEQKSELATMIEAGQADGTLGLPGAVTSPAIRQLVKNPRIQRGIAKGMQIERDLADADLRPMNVRDYAVIGEDAKGEPIVGAVPNMQLLAVAKQGLDRILESAEMRDPLTQRLNQEGRAVARLRNTLLTELDRLNPAYKVARDKWAGDSALIKAIELGKKFRTEAVEDLLELMAKFSDSEKKFFKIGVADALKDDLNSKVTAADPSKAIVNSRKTRQQLQAVIGPQQADGLLQKVKRARTMFATPVDILGNSKTAAREAEDMARRQGLESAQAVLHGVASAASGHAPLSYFLSKDFLRRANPLGPSSETERAVEAAIARILTAGDSRINVKNGQALLQSVKLPQVQSSVQRAMAQGLRRPVPNAMLQVPGAARDLARAYTPREMLGLIGPGRRP